MEVGLIHANYQLLVNALDAVIQEFIHYAAWDCAHGRTTVCAVILRIKTQRANRAFSMHPVLEPPNNERVPSAAAAPRRKNNIVSIGALLGTQIQSFRSLRKRELKRANQQSERNWNRSKQHV